MKDILATANRDVLARFAWSKVLVAFDFDGTLAPIVSESGAARMRPRTEALLAELTALYPCAVISGRSLKDVRARVAGTAVQHLVGNHGLEPAPHMARYARETAGMRAQLTEALADQRGIHIEDKRYSLAIHYRKARSKSAARDSIEKAIAGLDLAVRVVPGKLVVNVLPEGAPHKGVALRELRSKCGVDTAIYVGDDVTDEDVFSLDEPGRLLSVRVGAARSSAAAYYIRAQADIDPLLAALVEARQAGRGP